MELAASTVGLALPVLGFLIGGLVGATGVGAGALMTPTLVLGFGVSPLVAVGTDLLFATVTKTVGALAHHKLGTVDVQALRWLSMGSLPAAAVTLGILACFTGDARVLASVIRAALIGVLFLTAGAILARPLLNARPAGPTQEGSTAVAPAGRLVLIGALLGSLVALTSIGAGALGVVALAIALPALTTQRVIGTDIAHAIPLTLVCGTGHLAMGNIDPTLLATLLTGSVPGVLVGCKLGHRLSEPALRRLLAGVLLLAALLLIVR